MLILHFIVNICLNLFLQKFSESVGQSIDIRILKPQTFENVSDFYKVNNGTYV